ncbi:247b1061-932e-4f66-a1f4-323c766dce27 [Thermothielavioides terrestris]|uniref:247b1061-932e-4f66-a1f4-323c766dce27 n=1 Tax=Thermothielavioides terrestris TaxID=2587410 RepID=A0A3S4ANJ8_9PEZI|nr:247b1061-932e-4f66-a1f4-323c766dce27 [Thermothielavioides terrestris]
MSCNNRTPQRNHQESASMFDSDRILDRKIERQALPGSFSSNIGRKPPSPENKASVRSVRAMVRLFEQSARSSDSAKPQASRPSQASDTSGRAGGGSDGSEGCRAHHDNDNKDHEPVVRHTEPSMFPAALAFGCQVEEYSLTLLKHKSYFNNRPLARCLDDFCAKEKDSKPERVRAARDQANEPAVEKKRGNANGGKEGQADQGTCPITPPNRNQTSSPIQQLDSLRSGLLSWQGESERDTPGPGHKWTERDPREVDRFWCKNCPAWDEPPPAAFPRLNISAPSEVPIGDLLSEGSSGPWMHPPTWRSPFPLSSSSPPPPVPPLPALPPPSVSSASATTTTTNHYRRHVRHRHQPHSSKASTSISISTHSVAATDSRSSDASGSAQSMHSRERTHKTSTSSTATRSSRSGSSADLSAHRHHHYPPRTAPRRRLTAEEKLSEIDAFLSSDPERED